MARCVHSIDRENDTTYCDVMRWGKSEEVVQCNGRHAVCLGRGDEIKDIREEENHAGKDLRTEVERGIGTTQEEGPASSRGLFDDR